MSDKIIDQAEQVVSEPSQGQVIQDLLVNMFMRQYGHMQAYDGIYRAKGLPTTNEYGNVNNPAVQAKIRESLGYAVEEAYEAVNLLKNKPWKQSFRETDIEEFHKELADAWHFWLEMMIYAGMTPDLVQKYYFGVAESNDQRRAQGY